MSLKLAVRKKTHYRCCYCEKKTSLEIHHIIPQAEDGPDTEDNAAPLCPTCHDMLGDNTKKRKHLREVRDHWYKLCVLKESGLDSEAVEALLRKEFERLKDDLINDGPPHALTADPFNSPDFLGRKDELQQLHNQLFSGNHMLFLVNGVGGVGKTSLAARYYQTYKHLYAHVAWVLSEKSIADALLLLATSLQLQLDPQLPIEQRLEILLTKLANLDKPSLLVIDNANEIEDLQANYISLNRCENFHILLTTRITKFEKVKLFPVNGLPETEAIELFKKYYTGHQESEDTLLKEIIVAVGNNTLIVEILARTSKSSTN